MRVAVVGAGVAGLTCAYWLAARHEVTLFEANDRLGGHTNTVRVDLADETHYVDTGFIVYNEPNYPLFSGLLRSLGVATQPSDMSFSVSSGREDFEYRGNGLGLWAGPANALRPSHARFLADILRFNRLARHLAVEASTPHASQAKDERRNDDSSHYAPGSLQTLAQFVASCRLSKQLVDNYLVPLGSAVWSADPTTFLEMPAVTFVKFFYNHGFLQLKGRPRWRTVTGGACHYVDALAKKPRVRLRTPVLRLVREARHVALSTESGTESFDAAVLATHSDEALALLGDPSPAEKEVLGALRYQPNVATLHTDSKMLPRRRRAWASWNAYLPPGPSTLPKVTYLMNRLQHLNSSEAICVSLNRQDEVDPAKVIGTWTYSHPVLDGRAVTAQRHLPKLQGYRRTWYCGAYWGYGFHEDAVSSARSVATSLGAP